MALIQSNANTFANDISTGVALVDFYADWCGPCKMIAPVLIQISNEMPSVNIVKLNVDLAPQVAGQYGVQSIPTLILFKNGKKVAQTLGFQPKEMLKAWIQKNS